MILTAYHLDKYYKRHTQFQGLLSLCAIILLPIGSYRCVTLTRALVSSQQHGEQSHSAVTAMPQHISVWIPMDLHSLFSPLA
jgi:hypothetical protein